MKALCPTCGQQVAPLELFVCLQSNTASRLGRNVRLSPQQTVILHTLADKAPQALSAADLCVALYGAGDGPENENQTARSQMRYLRRRLAPLAIRIESTWGHGYRVVLDDLPARCAVAA